MSLTKEDALAWFEMQVKLPISGEIRGYAEEAALYTSGRLQRPEDALLSEDTSKALDGALVQDPALREQVGIAVFKQALFFKKAFDHVMPQLFSADGKMDTELLAELHTEVNAQLGEMMHQEVEIPLRRAGLTEAQCEEVGDKMQQALQISMAKFATRNLSPAEREQMWNQAGPHVERLRRELKTDPGKGRGG